MSIKMETDNIDNKICVDCEYAGKILTNMAENDDSRDTKLVAKIDGQK